ncbi:F-box/WD-40 repeat-containing protein 1-like [Daucus carota subsp. sativus]|uniref:F-box/WD-40 repeat-containing protein 1-like n=1 Tax=Daucus carota subsp. sativus TaxID=79200 RepID=UPI0030837C3C
MDTVEDSVELKLPSHWEGKVRYMRSCNGLVCLSNDCYDSICIWNPCTRQYKMLSVPNYAFGVRHCLGFGFDSIGNDYKILWIVTKVVRDLRGFIVSMNLKPEAQLYSAKADTWKKIRIPDTIRISFWNRLKRSCGPDISGKLYLEGEGGLLPFDLRNDVFGELLGMNQSLVFGC